MPMKYDKLFNMLKSRNMKKGDLLDVISEPTLAKLSKGENVSTSVLSAICKKLKCDISDIMEYEYSDSDGEKRTNMKRV